MNQLDPAVPGTPDRRCVEIGTNRDVRSGDFVAGNFAVYARIYRSGSAKLYWIPAHLPAGALTIRAARLGTPEPRVS